MKKFFKDFKDFITRGNIIDLAIGVIIGGAFSAIVNSLVNDIIMPLLTLATGDGVQGLSVVLNNVPKYLEDGTINPEAVLWNYGNFLQAIINFIIIALCLFLALKVVISIRKASEKSIEKMKKRQAEENGVVEETAQEPAAEPELKETADDLLREIRDLLKDGKNKTE